MKNILSSLLLLTGLLFSNYVFAQSGIDTVINQERANLIARNISENIVRRITTKISNPEDLGQASLGMQNPLAASADLGSLLPDSAWVATSWAEISDDDSLNEHVDADIYQVTAGIDKQLGDWFVGLSTTYAYTETEIGGQNGLGSQGDTHTVTVTPYAAFVINPNFFISALTSYTYSRNEPDVLGFNPISQDSETDEYTTELDLNALKVMGDLTLTGKAGVRYSHSDQYFDNSLSAPTRDNDQDNWTYLVDAQVRYSLGQFVNGLSMSAGALYEYIETEDGPDDGVLYMGTGLDYSVNKALSVGIRYSHDANNEDIDINTVALNLRMAI